MTNVAIWDGANVRILMDDVFFKIKGETLETVRGNFV